MLNEIAINNIIKLRREKNLSQKKFGEIVSLTRHQISDIETGRTKNVDLQLLERFAEKFGLEISYFLNINKY